MLSVLWQTAIVSGITIAGFLNLPFAETGPDGMWAGEPLDGGPIFPWGWRASFGGNISVAILLSVLMLGMPESPRWLFAHGKEEQGMQVLLKLRSTKFEAEQEAATIRGKNDRESNGGKSKPVQSGWGGLCGSEQPRAHPRILSAS